MEYGLRVCIEVPKLEEELNKIVILFLISIRTCICLVTLWFIIILTHKLAKKIRK
jgi:hypothetical protein